MKIFLSLTALLAGPLVAVSPIEAAPANLYDDGRFTCTSRGISDAERPGFVPSKWCPDEIEHGCRIYIKRGIKYLFNPDRTDVPPHCNDRSNVSSGSFGGGNSGSANIASSSTCCYGGVVYPHYGNRPRRSNHRPGDGVDLRFERYDYKQRRDGRPGDGVDLPFNGYDEYRPRSGSGRPSAGRDLPFDGYDEYRPRSDSSRPSAGRDLRFERYDYKQRRDGRPGDGRDLQFKRYDYKPPRD